MRARFQTLMLVVALGFVFFFFVRVLQCVKIQIYNVADECVRVRADSERAPSMHHLIARSALLLLLLFYGAPPPRC